MCSSDPSLSSRDPTRIPARRVGADSSVRELVDISKIAFVFLGTALEQGLIDAPWVRVDSLSAYGVYIRTIGGTTYQLTKIRLAPLQTRLGTKFILTERNVLSNVDHISKLDFATNTKRIGFRIGGNTEFVRVSRSAAHALSKRFGL
jgi:hypothetical protein